MIIKTYLQVNTCGSASTMLDLFIVGLFRAFNMCFEVRITIFKWDSEYTA